MLRLPIAQCGSGGARKSSESWLAYILYLIPMTEIEQALEHHRAGRLQQAEAIYRQMLRQEPNHPDALHLLGCA